MSWVWPAMSAITTLSGSTCPSHQESAWRAAEASVEKIIVDVVRKAIVVGKCWSMCWTHLQMFSVPSTVLGEKSSDVEQSWGAAAKLPGRRPPPHWKGRGQLKEGVMFDDLRVLLFVLIVWIEMDVIVNAFPMKGAILVRRIWTVEKDV